MNKLLSRKFIVAMSTLAAATVLLYLDKLAADHWQNVVTLVVGLYATANVAQAIGLKAK